MKSIELEVLVIDLTPEREEVIRKVIAIISCDSILSIVDKKVTGKEWTEIKTTNDSYFTELSAKKVKKLVDGANGVL